MKTYKVIWEVSKEAIVEAKNEDDAIEQIMNGDIDGEENEITTPCEAFEIK